MTILERPLLRAQQRFDLEDWEALLSGMRTDSQFWTKAVLSSENKVMSGMSATGIGGSTITIAMADSSFLIPESSSDFSYYVAPSGVSDIVIPATDLTNNVRNYIEATLVTSQGTPATKAFWDPDANSGAGGEFSENVNTSEFITVQISVNTSGFSGGDAIPVAIADLDSGGVVKVILDQRRLFGRLASPTDLDNEYSWGTKQEAIHTATLTGGSGTFLAGESITIGSVTAVVVTGGTTSITFSSPSTINFASGDTVTGADSGASRTLDTSIESFSGVDKDVSTIEDALKAIMTEVKGIKGTDAWWTDPRRSLDEIEIYTSRVMLQPDDSNGQVINVSASNFTQQSGAELNLSLLGQLLDFGGAVIDFDTGSIYEADGVTSLGNDYVVPTVAADQYRWFAVSITEGVTNADNSIQGLLTVSIGSADGATPDAAPKPVFADGIALGYFVLQRNSGGTAFEDVSYASIINKGLNDVTFPSNDATLSKIAQHVEGIVTGEETWDLNDTDQTGRVVRSLIENPIQIGDTDAIGGASFGSSLDISATLTAPLSACFSDGGTLLFVGRAGDVEAWDLSTPYDITTATHDPLNYLSGAVGVASLQYSFVPDDGTYIIYSESDVVKTRVLSTPHQIGGATTTTHSHDFSSDLNYNIQQFWFNDDGTELIILDSDTVNQASGVRFLIVPLSTAYEVSGTSVGTITNSTLGSSVSFSGFCFNSDGTKLYLIAGHTTDILEEFDLSTPYDVTTRSSVDTVDLTTGTTIRSLQHFTKTTGNSLLVADAVGDALDTVDLEYNYHGRSISWAAGFSWDGSANIDTGTFRATGPRVNEGCSFRGSGSFTTSNKFQVRQVTTGQYDIQCPVGTTWSDWVLLEANTEVGVTPAHGVNSTITLGGDLRIYTYRVDTGAAVDRSCAVSIGRVREI